MQKPTPTNPSSPAVTVCTEQISSDTLQSYRLNPTIMMTIILYLL